MADETKPTSTHTETARDLLQRVRATQEITGTKTLLKGKQMRKLINPASLPDDFLEAVAVALDAYPNLALASGVSAAEIRDLIAFSRANRPVVDEYRIAATSLLQEILTRRAHTGQQALKVYDMVQAMNRPNDQAMLVPHITAMRRALGNRGRKKAQTPTEPPVPVTPAPVTPVPPAPVTPVTR